MHNAVRNYAWATHAKKGDRPPKPLRESSFMPSRVKPKQSKEIEQQSIQRADRELRRTLNALCGF